MLRATPPERQPVLPELRQELRVERGSVDASGQETWLIVDSAQHRYVQLDKSAYQLLSRWRAGQTHQDLCDAVARDFGANLSLEDVREFVRYLADNAFLLEPESGDWRTYPVLADRQKSGWLAWLVHNYLYFKLPLVRPEGFLYAALPRVAALYTRGFAALILTCGLIGLYLVSRQWDAFYATFQHFFSWKGAAIYAVALILIKSAHELGHAFTAARFGCRVPTMGICFLVMFPVLYTDVSDAWRLRSRRDRLLIGGAGVAVELAIACIATLLWSFMPEGIGKSLAFSFATVGWILSLAINLNPLMRFDGYYLLSDLIGVENLQTRAFAFGRWRMRELLFGLGKRPPEQVTRRTGAILTVYAWAVWVYRFLLFTGIALLVYHMAFKLLGIALFLIEIVYFVLWPIATEIRFWWSERTSLVATGRSRMTIAIATLAVVFALLPWSSSVTIPAVIEAEHVARVYPQRAGVVESVLVKPGDSVKVGDVLVRLSSTEMNHQINLTKHKIALLKMRLARRSSDAEDRSNSLVLEQELRALLAQFDGLIKERADLTIVAPHSGIISELNPEVHVGRAIGRAEFIALVRGDGPLVVRGYIAQSDVARLGTQSVGHFVAELPNAPSFDVKLHLIAKSGASSIEIPELTSRHGGPIAVRPHSGDGGRQRLIPVDANYLAVMAVTNELPAPVFAVRGYATLEGARESVASRAWRQVAAVLVRESGF